MLPKKMSSSFADKIKVKAEEETKFVKVEKPKKSKKPKMGKLKINLKGKKKR
jgi:hypothetical protein